MTSRSERSDKDRFLRERSETQEYSATSECFHASAASRENAHSWQNGCNGGGCKPLDEFTRASLLSRGCVGADSLSLSQTEARACFAWWGALHRVYGDIKELKRKSAVDYAEMYLNAAEMNKKIFDYENSGFDPPESHAEIALNRLYWMFTDDNTNEIKFRDLWYSRIRIYSDVVGI